jgi:cell division protein FtsB
MNKFKAGNKSRKIKPIVFTVIGMLILIFLSYPLSKNLSQQYRISNEIKKLKDEISNVENNNSQLKKMIDYIGSDQFIDKEARLNLNYKKDGEQVVVIKGKEQDNNIQRQDKNKIVYQTNSSVDKQSAPSVFFYPYKWWKYFFD